jgi:hypothetical protein
MSAGWASSRYRLCISALIYPLEIIETTPNCRFPREPTTPPSIHSSAVHLPLLKPSSHPRRTASNQHPTPAPVMLVTKRVVHASSSIPRHVRSLATAVATDPSSSTTPASSASARRFPKLDDGLTLADFASGEPLEDRVTLGNTQQCVDRDKTSRLACITHPTDLVCHRF